MRIADEFEICKNTEVSWYAFISVLPVALLCSCTSVMLGKHLPALDPSALH